MVRPIFLTSGKRVESFGASYEVTPIRVSISWIKRTKEVGFFSTSQLIPVVVIFHLR
jgi:hypothetical protein